MQQAESSTEDTSRSSDVEETEPTPASRRKTQPMPKTSSLAKSSKPQSKPTQSFGTGGSDVKTRRKKPKTMSSAIQDGTVLDKGVLKTFEFWRALPGAYDKNHKLLRHQMMVSYEEPRGYTMYEFIKSSYFGKGTAQSWKDSPQGREFKTGHKSLLKDKTCREKRIASVCPVRRTGPPPVYMINGRKEFGWLRRPTTYVYITFDNEAFHWFTISDLRYFWGAAIDRDVEQFCTEAGQKLPGGHTIIRKADYESNNEGEDKASIDLGETSGDEDDLEENDYDYDDEFVDNSRKTKSKPFSRAQLKDGPAKEHRQKSKAPTSDSRIANLEAKFDQIMEMLARKGPKDERKARKHEHSEEEDTGEEDTEDEGIEKEDSDVQPRKGRASKAPTRKGTAREGEVSEVQPRKARRSKRG